MVMPGQTWEEHRENHARLLSYLEREERDARAVERFCPPGRLVEEHPRAWLATAVRKIFGGAVDK